MGIYEREYYRDKTRGSGWLTGASPACNVLIAINVAAFVGQHLLPPGLLEQTFRANGEQIFHGFQVWRLLTATFLHGDVWHILMNMLFLWMVGREMEPFYGTRDFTALYLAAAVFSTLCWAVVDTFDPEAGNNTMIGASGAVLAVGVLYTLYYPRREVLFMLVIPVQMWVLLSVYLGWNFIQFLNPNPSDRTAYSAHLGGAAFGYLFKVGDLRLSRLESMFRRKPRLRIVPAEPRESSPATRPSIGPTWSSGLAASARPTPAATVIPEDMFDEKLDEILVKIAREGRGALSEDENRVLEEASRRARNRRSERI